MSFRRPSPTAIERAERRLRALSPVLRPLADALSARDAATLDTQVRLAQLAAPTGGEARRAALVADAFRLRGFPDVRCDRVGNVIVRRPARDASRAPIVCLAHLDTVFPSDTPLLLRHDGARLVCPGIGDNARGLAAMLAIADTLGVPGLDGDALPLDRPVEFVATVGEEGLGNLRGARGYFDDLAANGIVPHAVVALDGPGDERIVHHALGSRRYRIVFDGPGGHSWADFGRPNAIHAATRAAFWLATLPSESPGRLAVSVGRIGGGESLTAIPAHAWLEVDVRATHDAVLARADRQLRSVVRQAVLDENRGHVDAPLTVELALLGERPAGELSADHPVVALAKAATRDAGREPLGAIASTDANVPLSRGIPAITIGAGGRGGGAHTPDEWYENTDGARGVTRALSILVALATCVGHD
jgi:acetylornithine deacetylase/succinyl-diaminopimelate desuccinylase-like protein